MLPSRNRNKNLALLVILGLLPNSLQAEETPKPTDGNILKVTANSMGMEIMGSIISKMDSSQSVALIKILSSGKVRAFRPSFELELAQNYLIIAINSEAGSGDYIEVKEKGSGRVLRILKAPFVDNSTPVASQTVPAPVTGFSDSYKEDGFERNKDKISLTTAYRDDLIKNQLQKILMQASAEPVVKDGAIIGFLMDEMDPNSIFIKAGLVNGDIVNAINDIALNSIPSTIKLLNSLKNATEVGADITRGGQKFHVTIQVQ